jgi:putative glutamine amidotransferase
MGVETAQAVMTRYVDAAMRYADAAALLIPALPGLMRADEVAPRLDGLLLTGSPSNLSPARYGQPEAAATAPGPFDANRDDTTSALIRAMTAQGKPVFGICRGLQELNVAFGGTLRRDMNTADELLRHHAPDDVGFDEMFAHEHEVELSDGGLLRRATGEARITVNSVHFQGIDRLGEGLTVEARAPDGVVEAFSTTVGSTPVLAVQWHPEWRPAENPQSQAFFRLLGRAMRGDPL